MRTNMTSTSRAGHSATRMPRRALAVLALAAAVPVVPVGCSSDDDSTAPTTTAPEQRISSDADVAAGLTKMKASADAVAAATSGADATAADDQLEPVWQTVEGTVRQNEPELYTDVEDSLSLLSAGAEGDAAKATAGAHDMTTAIDAYLTKHPG